jgi:hypothetical protein
VIEWLYQWWEEIDDWVQAHKLAEMAEPSRK